MVGSEDVNGYWGPITASTEWCESNYAVTAYVAEFYNTISNLVSVLLGLLGLFSCIRQGFERRFICLYLSVIAGGIGSALFHATLRNVQQQSDETPMVWNALIYLYVLYSPDWHYRRAMPTFLFFYATIFAVIHNSARFVLGFQIHYILLVMLCMPRMYKYYLSRSNHEARKVAHIYLQTLILGSICWLIDRTFCNWIKLVMPFNFQGHAWWHVLMGVNSYYGCTFLQYCRGGQLDRDPKITFFLGLPLVKLTKPVRLKEPEKES
eukprot:TRINITY_DN4496_c0_g1_i2.p1 TRINITY_DN4496_c0_g1~~TRINITY_DN4496_c0_g1_i2.p1  ORF type:complete len:265 (-),score=17.95 TRINITY_DN4496_c0_g1_i2:1068-1862(-)